MKLKQAKAIVWQQANEAVAGENGVLANGLRVRSQVKSGDCSTKTEERTVNDGFKGYTQTRECTTCTARGSGVTNVRCTDWQP